MPQRGLRQPFALLFEPLPEPEREPERLRLELPVAFFFGPVPDAPGRLALFFAPDER